MLWGRLESVGAAAVGLTRGKHALDFTVYNLEMQILLDIVLAVSSKSSLIKKF